MRVTDSKSNGIIKQTFKLPSFHQQQLVATSDNPQQYIKKSKLLKRQSQEPADNRITRYPPNQVHKQTKILFKHQVRSKMDSFKSYIQSFRVPGGTIDGTKGPNSSSDRLQQAQFNLAKLHQQKFSLPVDDH